MSSGHRLRISIGGSPSKACTAPRRPLPPGAPRVENGTGTRPAQLAECSERARARQFGLWRSRTLLPPALRRGIMASMNAPVFSSAHPADQLAEFADADAALARIREIYEASVGAVRARFDAFANGKPLPSAAHACYPYLGIS